VFSATYSQTAFALSKEMSESVARSYAQMGNVSGVFTDGNVALQASANFLGERAGREKTT
jgi:hypothetical protein